MSNDSHPSLGGNFDSKSEYGPIHDAGPLPLAGKENAHVPSGGTNRPDLYTDDRTTRSFIIKGPPLFRNSKKAYVHGVEINVYSDTTSGKDRKSDTNGIPLRIFLTNESELTSLVD